jgi:hypothetical protein
MILVNLFDHVYKAKDWYRKPLPVKYIDDVMGNNSIWNYRASLKLYEFY